MVTENSAHRRSSLVFCLPPPDPPALVAWIWTLLLRNLLHLLRRLLLSRGSAPPLESVTVEEFF